MKKIIIDDKCYEGKLISKNENVELYEFKKTDHGIGSNILGVTFINEIKNHFPNIKENDLNMIDNEYFLCIDGKLLTYLG